MTDSTKDRMAGKLILGAVVLSLMSLFLPWWNLIVLENGQLLSYSGFHLWGVMKSGFVRSDFSFEWWFYTALLILIGGCLSGLLGYRFIKTRIGKAKKAVVLGLVLTLTGCIFSVINLAHSLDALSSSFGSGAMNFWMIDSTGRMFRIGLFSLFHFSYFDQILFFEFLSAGFFLTVISMILLLVALLRIRSKVQT